MSAAREALRQEFRELEYDIERANAYLAIAICGVSNVGEHNIFEEDGEGKVVSIDEEAIRELLDDVENAEVIIDAAIADHNWKIAQALRSFKETLERGAASSPSPVNNGSFLDELDPNKFIAAIRAGDG